MRVILLFIPLLLSACHMLPKIPEPRVVMGESTINASGAYDISQVIVDDRGHSVYELAAAAKEPFPVDEMYARLWCRANRFAHENSYTGWYLLAKKTQSLEDAYSVHGIVQMFRGTRPDGKSGLLKDWCAVCEAAKNAANNAPGEVVANPPPIIPTLEPVHDAVQPILSPLTSWK